jgi:hypothetical protein
LISGDSGDTESQDNTQEENRGYTPTDKPNFLKRGHYALLPIPAFQVLAKAGDHNAQKVLLALVLHMGKGTNCVWPTYHRIMAIVGIGKSSVRNGLLVLKDLGFIKVAKWQVGKESRVKYYIQDCCYNSGLMSEKAKGYRVKMYRCFACLALIDRGEFGISGDKKVHFGCGGYVISVKPRNISNSREEKGY